ncbi:MAG: efflux transporter outer membrane subunit [Pontiellaceae bacterium]|nr:efflux transporter outer membrane subunit [Pontiellaceae bacterium]MBN2785034.1 efflux transporter outer membrane subunit [Pontiellaceae bacterium]
MTPRNFIMIAALLPLAGCTMLKPDHDGALNAYVAETYSRQGGDAAGEGPWWKSFNSPELDRLMDEAFSGNLSLAKYAARLRQQQALAAKAGASGIPTLSGTGSAGTTRPDITESRKVDAYALGLSASYELDLWGRVASTAQTAALSREASRFDLQSATLSLSANIADTWLAIIAQESKLDLLRGQLDANTKTLELLQLRQRNAISTQLDVLQQKQVVESTKALIPAAELQLELLKSQLNVLLGRIPGAPVELSTKTLPALPDLPFSGIPADLLIKRPDIQAGLARLESKEYAVAAARADQLPTLTLSGSLSASDSDLGNLLDNWAGNLAAGLVAPLIDGGRRRSEVAYQQALTDEALAAYQSTVLTAITEVNDALATEQKTAEQLAIEEQQQQTLSSQLSEADLRYRKGLNTYLTVLNALSAKQSLERSLITTRINYYTARIELYRALGGDWNINLLEPASK